MRKNVLFALMLLGASLLVASVVTQSYTIPTPVLSQHGEWTHVALEGGAVVGEPGAPAIPEWPVRLLLPPGEQIVSVELEWSEAVNLGDGYHVTPQQTPVPISRSESATFTEPNNAIYSVARSWPYSEARDTDTQYLRGHSIGLLQLAPVRYNPVSGQLSYHPWVNVTIITEPTAESQAAYTRHRGDQTTVSRVSRAVDNAQAVYQYPTQTRDRINGHMMVIVTGEDQVEYFDEFVEFKTKQGMNPLVMTVEEINANYTGVDEQARIREFIDECYNEYNTEYVILGGDVQIVPFRGMYLQAGDTTDYGLPADMYYSCLDRLGTGIGPDWNVDSDNYWGEPGESDYYPELAIGRISANTSAQFEAALHKQIMYQLSPVANDCEKVLMVGEELNDNPQTNGGDYKDQIITGGSFNGYTTTGVPTNFTTGTMYERDGYWGRNDLQTQMNAGLNLLNHLGHSNTDYNMKFSNGDVTDYNLTSNGVNHNFFLIYSQGCYSSSFDYNDAIAEKFTTIENGVFCYVGNSRYGWYNAGGTDSSSQFLDRYFYDAIFGQDITRVGDANDDSKYEAAAYCNSNAWFRWTVYEVNVLGDPSADIWTAAPQTLTPEYSQQIPLNTTIMTVSAGAPDALICVSRDGEEIASTIANASGNAVLNFDEAFTELGTLDIYITAHDYLIHTGQIQVIAADQPFVIVENWAVEAGGDDRVEFGESGTLSLTLKNIGQQPSDALSINLSTTSDYLTFTDATEDISALAAGQEAVISAGFAFDVDADVPDIEQLEVTVGMSDGTYSWDPRFAMIAHAPNLALGDVTVNDANGQLDPGETVDIAVRLANIGSADLHDIEAALSTSDPYVTVNSSAVSLDALSAETDASLTFNITVSDEAQLGYMASFILNVDAEQGLDFHENMVLVIGNITENFETGDFSAFEWETSGSANWTITNAAAHEGLYCARSGSIGSNQATSLTLTLNVLQGGNIGFWVKVSCENDPNDNYDFLSFSIDGQEQDRWDGEVNWTHVSFPVASGEHTFTWQYSKDTYQDDGQDCGWIDLIEFPPFVGDALAVFLLTPANINFGEVEVGESQSRTFSIFNMGDATMSGAIEVPDYFTLEGPGSRDSEPYAIEPSQYAQFTLTYAPGEEGNHTCDIYITSNDPFHAANVLHVVASTYPVGVEGDTPQYVDALLGNHPNPFNPTTTVALSVAADHTPVRVDVYNVRGQRVVTLFNGALDSGEHSLVWRGADENEQPVGSGVYFLRTAIGEKTFMRKMLMLK